MSQSSAPQRDWLAYVIGAAGALLVVFLIVYRLDIAPALWFDEGSHLHVAKNLAIHGVYADFSSEGNRYGGPVVALGPTVLLPIAGLFKVFGIKLFWARLVVVIYALFTLATLLAMCRYLKDSRLGIVAVALMVVSPGLNLWTYARSVLGEVPGLFFVIAGLYIWLRPSEASRWRLVLAGVSFGLACVTKNQYALIILPALFAAWIAEILWYRQRGWLYFIVPGLIAGLFYAGWMYFVLFVLGRAARDVNEDFAVLRATSAFSFFVFNIGDGIEFLTDGSVYAALFLPSLLYSAALGLRRDEEGQRWGILTLFVLVGTAFYLTSLAWPRYAFLPVALGAPLVARVLYDLSAGFRPDWQAARNLLRGQAPTSGALVGMLAVGLLVVTIAWPLYAEVQGTFTRPGHTDALQMAAYLDDNVAPTEVIETLEQEFAVLTDHPYHYPPQRLVVDVTAQWVDQGRKSGLNYDNFEYPIEADYVLIRSDQISADFYSPQRLADFEPIQTFGNYTLYQRQSP